MPVRPTGDLLRWAFGTEGATGFSLAIAGTHSWAFSLSVKLGETPAQYAHSRSFAPLAVAVLDVRGSLKAFAAEEDTPLGWGDIAIGKARGALAMGLDSRWLGEQALERPHFIAAVTHVVGGSLVPVAGGVVICIEGKVAGAVGIAGDTSDNDEAAAKAGIAAAF